MNTIIFEYESPELTIVKGSPGSAGWDIKSAESVIIKPGERYAVSTGATLKACPQDCYLRMAPRSGHAYKFGIDVFAGVIDSDYRGELKAILYNSGSEAFGITRGDRVAQLIPTALVDYQVNGSTNAILTERGEGGFGSTNK